MLWLGLLAFDAGAITGPVWAGMLLGAIGLFEVLGPLMRGAARLGATAEGAKRVRTVFEMKPAIVQAGDAADLPESGDIEFHDRSEEHTSELQSLMSISYAVFCLKKKKNTNKQ